MADEFAFVEEEISVDEKLGFPKAYAKLCGDFSFSPYSYGPPFTFSPCILQQNEVLRTVELDNLFPVIDPNAKPNGKPEMFAGLLWKQLNHLGNAGFDPEVIRVDPYGNVVYFHADPASPLTWDIAHWFPSSRGGLTVPSNLRVVQWQVCKKMHNKLELLIPWWDLQLGVSVNQFLSIFASTNSDFRHRAFSFLFSEGESEELNALQTVDSHNFPQHYIEMIGNIGLAPAAIVATRSETYDNRQPHPRFPAMAARKAKSILKENENPNLTMDPYQEIVKAKTSLKGREEISKMQEELQKLDDEVIRLMQKNEEERLSIQDLELVLIKRRKRAEKCRQLAEAQSSYKSMLEKMIRDAMHQSVVYKEQVRLNQAASKALMARLEAQRAICDSSEIELHSRYKQRDEIEKQIRPEWEQARKRSRMDDILLEDGNDKSVTYLPEIRQEEIEEEPQKSIEGKLEILQIGQIVERNVRFNVCCEAEKEEDEESKKRRGKGNVEKWLQMLLQNNMEELESENVNENEESKTDKILSKLNSNCPIKGL